MHSHAWTAFLVSNSRGAVAVNPAEAAGPLCPHFRKGVPGGRKKGDLGESVCRACVLGMLCGSSIVHSDTGRSFLSNKSAPWVQERPHAASPLSLRGNLGKQEAWMCLWPPERAGGQQERVEWTLGVGQINNKHASSSSSAVRI
ncbi:hypothetical protein SRHO_G00219530 [Serrasalmus rhombeus]